MLERQNIEHQKEILATQVEMQQLTMQEIGREIHDNVGQKLTLASIYTQQLSHENQAPQVNSQIENIANIINQSLAELRTLSKTLTDNAIETNPISKLLKTECNKINALKICKIQYHSNAKNLELDYKIKAVLVRISQEFLQNSIKHSGCENCTVSLDFDAGIVTLKLEDDGKGFQQTQTKNNGIGLSNMKKRTEMIGGVFNFETHIGVGTKLEITIEL